MATVDTTIRFNKFNSLILAGDETSWSNKFDVEFYSVLTVQTQALCLDGSTTGQFILRWLDEDGERVIDSTDGFDIDNRWVRKTATFAVPERAVEAMFAVKNTGGLYDIRIACAMVEAGEIASAFDPSLASQASYLDAHGLYTGTVTANQVRAGILLALTGEAWFDLEKPEIVMKGKDATWRASPENPLRLEDNEGNLLGGLIRMSDGKTALMTSAISNYEHADYGFGTIGMGPDGGTGYYFEHKGQKFIWCFTGAEGSDTFGAALYLNNIPRIGLHIDGGFSVRDLGSKERLGIYSNGTFVVRNSDSEERLTVTSGGGFVVRDSASRVRIQVSDTDTLILSPNGKQALGADNLGSYFIEDGLKFYTVP